MIFSLRLYYLSLEFSIVVSRCIIQEARCKSIAKKKEEKRKKNFQVDVSRSSSIYITSHILHIPPTLVLGLDDIYVYYQEFDSKSSPIHLFIPLYPYSLEKRSYGHQSVHNLLTEVGPHHNVPCAILRHLKGNN